MIIVSACLAGINCRFEGGNSSLKEIESLIAKGEAIPLCPEQLGGLPTPRSPGEIVEGEGEDVLAGRAKVINEDGFDVTRAFIKGAEEVLRIAKLMGVKRAILKQRSPSCGAGELKRRGKIIKGDGVTTALLKREGISVEGVG